MKIAYIRPDLGVPVDDTDLIREVDRAGTVRYRNSDGQLHRKDGPAVECSNGTREWWLWGKLHREDGPAVELANGSREWYLSGWQLSEYEFEDCKPTARSMMRHTDSLRGRPSQA